MDGSHAVHVYCEKGLSALTNYYDPMPDEALPSPLDDLREQIAELQTQRAMVLSSNARLRSALVQVLNVGAVKHASDRGTAMWYRTAQHALVFASRVTAND